MERRRTLAGLGLESESGAGREKVGTGGTRSPVKEWGRGEKAGRAEENGPGRSCWPARKGKIREEKIEGRGPGCAEREGELGHAGGGEKGQPGLGRKGKGK
jgi:hypothetical protein